MEAIIKISVLLLLSFFTRTTNTNCYKPCFNLEVNVAKKEVKKEAGAKQEMDGFWLTQFLMVEG